MDTNSVLFAMGLTLFAGLSTGIGSLMAFLSKEYNHKFLAGSLGFSAGVMIYVSFVELFQEAKITLINVYGIKTGTFYTTLAFFIGIGIIAIIDKLVPSYENPHEMKNFDKKEKKSDSKLLRMGIFSALAIAIHNFPEGMATFIAALQKPTLGISIAIAIAIHNIPEGLAVSAPIYYATKSKRKAFTLSFLSGLSEPIGAIIGYVILRNYINEATLGFVFSGVAGIMIYISLDELLPTAEEFGQHHIAIWGLVLGMIVMAVSLLLFV